jgi:hypothetical protein
MQALCLPSVSSNARSQFLKNAILGSLAWAVGIWILEPGWAAAILLMAPLVHIPCGLALVLPDDESCGHFQLRQVIPVLQGLAALVLLVAFALSAGPLAAGLALPWLVVTVLIAYMGAVRLLALRAWRLEDICLDAGLIYLAVGGAWTVLSRWGLRPLGFSDIIVLATAVHFHYAGFVLPLLTGLAGNALPGRTARCAAVGVVLGVPLVALGITLSAFEITWVECVTASFLAVTGLLVAWLQLCLAIRSASWPTRLLFGLSGVSLVVGMALAAVYAVGIFWGFGWLDIPFMLPYHGAVNALGFALLGLVAWISQSPPSE